MKKLFIASLCLLLLCLCACVSTAPEDTATTKKATQGTSTEENPSISMTANETFKPSTATTKIRATESNLYSDILKEYYDYLDDEDGYSWARYYAYYDIDRNGTDELLLGADWGGIGIIVVYSIQDDVAVQQEQFLKRDPELTPPPLLFRNGTIRREGVSDIEGELSYGYFRFEDGELKGVAGLNTKYDEYFRYNSTDIYPGTHISKEEYERLKKEMEGDGQVVELDWKPLAEYGR